MHRSYLYPHNPTFGALSQERARFFALRNKNKTEVTLGFMCLSAAARSVFAVGRMAHVGLPALAVGHERLELILKAHGRGVLGRLRRSAARRLAGTLLEPRLPWRGAAGAFRT